jgi:dipeptidyl aminopeptidase/acylaminoacyl peptidase
MRGYVKALLLSSVAVVAITGAASSPAVTSKAPQLSFVRNSSVYVVRANGTAALVVRGTSRVQYSDPAWSPQGRLALTEASQPTGTHDYTDVIVRRPGKPALQVPGGDSCCSGAASWAADGKHLVLVGYQFNNGGGLYVWEVGSRTNDELTPEYSDGSQVDDWPAWSPDGSRIAFARIDDSGLRLWTIKPDGSMLTRVGDMRADNPSWSPDSKRLAFDDGRRIGVIDATGANLRYLRTPRGRDVDPAWSPDGRTIAFVHYQSRRSRPTIWTVSATGANAHQVIANGSQPAWKPR